MDGGPARSSRSVDSRGRVKLSSTAGPDCRAAKSLTATGTTGCRGVGSPGAAHPPSSARASRQGDHASGAEAAQLIASQNITAQVLVLYDVGKLLGDVRAIHLHGFFLQFRRLEGDLIEYFFEDGVQAARADVFCLLVDHHCEA